MRDLGGDMNKRLALTLVFLLSTVCVPLHANDNKNCGLKQLASLDVAQFPGRVLVPVNIQGRSVWMHLDTGSPTSAILDDEARALKLHRRAVFVGTSTSAGAKGTVVQGAVADDLQMGHLHLRDVSFATALRSAYSEPATFDQRPIVGEIGMDVLSTVDFELDIAHGKLNLFSQDHCPGQVVYWSGPVASIALKRSDLGDQVMHRGPTVCHLITEPARFPHKAQIGLDKIDVTVAGGSTDLPFRPNAFLGIATNNDDFNASLRQRAGDLFSDTVGAPRNQRCSTSQLLTHGLSPS